MSTSFVQPEPRTENFAVGTDTVELEIALGTGSVTIELVEDLTEIEVVLAVGAGAWWQQGLTGVLSMLSAGGTERPDASNAVAGALSATEITYDTRRGRLVLRAPRTAAPRGASLDAQVRAPGGARVLVRSSSAAVQVSGPASQVDISTGSGEVRLQEARESAEIRTGSGAVRLGELRRGGRLRSGSGDISVDSTAGDLELISGSGDLRFGVAPGVRAELDLASASGKVRSELELLESPPSESYVHLRARTGSGAVVVHPAR